MENIPSINKGITIPKIGNIIAINYPTVFPSHLQN
jgi:hypothetical protein